MESVHTKSSVFITFNGNCQQAFVNYQACFGGELYMETFEKPIVGYTERPVVRAILDSPKLLIQGSDLVHDEGRRVGNYMAVFINCINHQERQYYINQLHGKTAAADEASQPLIEVIDRFDVRWVFAV